MACTGFGIYGIRLRCYRWIAGGIGGKNAYARDARPVGSSRSSMLHGMVN